MADNDGATFAPEEREQHKQQQRMNNSLGALLSGLGESNQGGSSNTATPSRTDERSNSNSGFGGSGQGNSNNMGTTFRTDEMTSATSRDSRDGNQSYPDDYNSNKRRKLETTELEHWGDTKKLEQEYDDEWFEHQHKELDEMYGEGIVTMKYNEQGTLSYYCELCFAVLNAKKPLEMHCSGMKHLKKKDQYEKSIAAGSNTLLGRRKQPDPSSQPPSSRYAREGNDRERHSKDESRADYHRSSYSSERDPYRSDPYGERDSYRSDPYGERDSYRSDPYSERPPYRSDPYSERPSYRSDPYSERDRNRSDQYNRSRDRYESYDRMDPHYERKFKDGIREHPSYSDRYSRGDDYRGYDRPHTSSDKPRYHGDRSPYPSDRPHTFDYGHRHSHSPGDYSHRSDDLKRSSDYSRYPDDRLRSNDLPRHLDDRLRSNDIPRHPDDQSRYSNERPRSPSSLSLRSDDRMHYSSSSPRHVSDYRDDWGRMQHPADLIPNAPSPPPAKPPAPVISSPPIENPGLAGGPAAALLTKLAECVVKNEGDAELASNVINLLLKSLKDYNQKIGEKSVAELMEQAEIKLGTAKAIRGVKKPATTTPTNAVTLAMDTLRRASSIASSINLPVFPTVRDASPVYKQF